MAEIDDSHISVRFRHGVHIIYLFVESQAPFSDISSELAAILRDRYPGGLTTSLEPPTTTEIPAQPKFVYGVLNKHNDPARGWKRLNVGSDEDFTPTKCGLKHNSLVAFMLQDGSDDPDDVVFRVEWPSEDEELIETCSGGYLLQPVGLLPSDNAGFLPFYRFFIGDLALHMPTRKVADESKFAVQAGYMLVASRLRNGLGLLVPLTLACSIYLYLYPFFEQCAFPIPSRDATEAFEGTKKLHWPFADEESLAKIPTKQAPFRLLALGDPQLEGDTSIPIAYAGFMPHVPLLYKQLTFQTWHQSLKERIRWSMHDLVDIFFDDIPNILESARKVFDLFGNDFYLSHIYKTLHWWTNPTHVSVLGDLLGSQWIEDDEFERRGRRFWNRTFKGGERVPDDVAVFPAHEYNLTGFLNGSPEENVWKKRIINIAGNHDIGYAGDLTEERLERFERVFGKANYELRFELPISDPEHNATIVNAETNPDSKRLAPELRIVVLNDMNLDTPAKSVPLQDETYKFINSVIGTSAAVEFEGHFTLILTHIPMYKPAGICVDAPFFDFHSQTDGGGLKEQYLLSSDASKGLLEGIFGVSGDTNAPSNGLGRKGMVMNGHDHEGCDTYHFMNQTNGTNAFERSWETVRWKDARLMNYLSRSGLPGRREITVRSMMGDFGGNAGLLSMWFNFDTWEWEHEYVDCPLGSQHFWWLTHFLIFGTIACAIAYVAVITMSAAGVDVDGYNAIVEKWLRKQVLAVWAQAKAKMHRKTTNDDKARNKSSLKPS